MREAYNFGMQANCNLVRVLSAGKQNRLEPAKLYNKLPYVETIQHLVGSYRRCQYLMRATSQQETFADFGVGEFDVVSTGFPCKVTNIFIPKVRRAVVSTI